MKLKKSYQNRVSNHSRRNLGYSWEQKVASIYARTTGSTVQIFDSYFQPCGPENESGIEQNICRHCTGDCQKIHLNAIREAGRQGRPQIYQCELGLMFWVSPVFSDGKFSGTLQGSGYLNSRLDSSALTEKCKALCNGSISPDKFAEHVLAFPSGDAEKIRSLSEMLLLCAKSLSSGSENYHELLRLRSEQQASLSALIDELKEKYPEGSSLPGYPLDKEHQLIDSLHRGDKEVTEKYLNEILAILIFSNPNQFRYIQLRALELAVLLVRGGMNSGIRIAEESNLRYLKQIQEMKSVEGLTGILHNIVENISGQISSFQGIPHAFAMRKAEAFIRENIGRKISLSEISKVAGLSAPYFSTIFKEEMGENLSRYINRLRVEKASKMLLETNFTLGEISTACCFEDQSWFSKIFKSFAGISPGKYRSQGGNVVYEIDDRNISANA